MAQVYAQHEDEPSGLEIEAPVHPRDTRERNKLCTRLQLFSWLLILALLFVLTYLIVTMYKWNDDHDHGTDNGGTLCLSPACVTLSASLLASVDPSVQPCKDFYSYSCGKWMQNQEIPPSKSRWSQFDVVDEANQKLLRKLVEDPNATTSDQKAEAQKAIQFYALCNNVTAIDEQGAAPVLDLVASLVWRNESEWGTTDFAELTSRLSSLANLDIFPFFENRVGPDDRNSSRNILFVSQSGLGLPREYYLNGSGQEGMVEAYRVYMVTLFQLVGINNTDARDIIALETSLASFNVPMAELRDPLKTYNNMTVQQLNNLAPNIPWSQYFQSVLPGTQLDDKLVIVTPSYLRNLSQHLTSYSQKTVMAYLQAQALTALAPHLSAPFRAATLAFNHAVRGVEAELPRWQTCIRRTDSALGFALGKLFIDSAFRGASKPIALDMIDSIVAYFKANLDNLSWMDAQTRAAAREKADAIQRKIGYPDFITHPSQLAEYYSDFRMNSTYFGTILNALTFEVNKNRKDITKPVDKTKWEMSPATVNAYYNPSNNEIVFPAGILQPPFFHQDYPLAYNYGGIGVVMGHELTHGFDDQGSQYDAEGNLRAWWPQNVRDLFNNKTQCMVDQYSNYTLNLLGNVTHVKGDLTLGENIADNGGLKQAYHAYRTQAETDPPIYLPAIDTNSDKLFFLGFTQVWCNLIRPEMQLLYLPTDPHSPPQYRVIGSVSNHDTFATIFNCDLGTPMNPKNKCSVW